MSFPQLDIDEAPMPSTSVFTSIAMQDLLLPPLHPASSHSASTAHTVVSATGSASGISSRASSGRTFRSAEGGGPWPSAPSQAHILQQLPPQLRSSGASRTPSCRSNGDASARASTGSLEQQRPGSHRSAALQPLHQRTPQLLPPSPSPPPQQQQQGQEHGREPLAQQHQEQQQQQWEQEASSQDVGHSHSALDGSSTHRSSTGAGGGGSVASTSRTTGSRGSGRAIVTGGEPPPVQLHDGDPAGAAAALAATPQTLLAMQQAALKKEVQRDIQRMLASNRAYTRAVQGPPTLSAEGLARLAKPKQQRGDPGLEAQVESTLSDPVDWAVWKTEQLAISRLTDERRAAEVEAEKRTTAEALARFKQRKAEEKQAKTDAKARAAAEEAAYRATMSAFLNHRAAQDLEDYKKKRGGDRERLALQRSRNVKGVGAHHF